MSLNLDSMREKLEDRLALKQSYHKVFDSPEGQRVLRHLMGEAGILKPKIIADPNLLLIQQGQKHIVLSIIRILGLSTDKIIEQIKESMTNENQ